MLHAFWKSVSIILSLLSFAGICSGGSFTQTDWSEGPGTLGPVPAVGDEFYCDTETNWSALPGNLTCEFSGVYCFIGPGSPLDACTGDFNNDGYEDAAAAHWWHDRVDFYINADGTGMTWTAGTVCDNFDFANVLAAGDFDGDGRDDIVASANYDEVLSVFISPDSIEDPWERNDVQTPMTASFLEACDINGDGYVDILGTSYDPDRISWWENSGTGTEWTRHTVASVVTPKCARAVDFDGDGDQDILEASYSFDRLAWWENEDGSGTDWTLHYVGDYFQFASSVDCGDFDSDGDLDVVGISYIHGLVTLWENVDGAGTTWSRRDIADVNWVRSVTVCDIDMDGDLDVTVASNSLEELIWLENLDGSGYSWSPHPCAYYEDPEVLCVSDLNGDGKPDFLSCSNEENSVAWWNSVAEQYTELGRLESSILEVTGCSFPIDWGTISWNTVEPESTYVRFLVRSASDPDSILYTEWSDTISTSGHQLSGILGENDQYVQYKALLTSGCQETPVLEDVTITWSELGLGEGTGDLSTPGIYPASNPSRGTLSVAFLPIPGEQTEISIYDLSGRIQRSRIFAPDVSGSFVPESLPPGLYCIVMKNGPHIFSKMVTLLP